MRWASGFSFEVASGRARAPQDAQTLVRGRAARSQGNVGARKNPLMPSPLLVPRSFSGAGLASRVQPYFLIQQPTLAADPDIRREGAFRREFVAYDEWIVAEPIDHVASDSYAGYPATDAGKAAAAAAAIPRVIRLLARQYDLLQMATSLDGAGKTQDTSPAYSTQASIDTHGHAYIAPAGSGAPAGRTVLLSEMKAGLAAIQTDIDAGLAAIAASVATLP